MGEAEQGPIIGETKERGKEQAFFRSRLGAVGK